VAGLSHLAAFSPPLAAKLGERGEEQARGRDSIDILSWFNLTCRQGSPSVLPFPLP